MSWYSIDVCTLYPSFAMNCSDSSLTLQWWANHEKKKKLLMMAAKSGEAMTSPPALLPTVLYSTWLRDSGLCLTQLLLTVFTEADCEMPTKGDFIVETQPHSREYTCSPLCLIQTCH